MIKVRFLEIIAFLIEKEPEADLFLPSDFLLLHYFDEEHYL